MLHIDVSYSYVLTLLPMFCHDKFPHCYMAIELFVGVGQKRSDRGCGGQHLDLSKLEKIQVKLSQ